MRHWQRLANTDNWNHLMCLRDMKYIGFKHQRENKQNSDKTYYCIMFDSLEICFVFPESNTFVCFLFGYFRCFVPFELGETKVNKQTRFV